MKKKMSAPKVVEKRVKESQERVKMKDTPKAPTMGKGAKKRNVKVTNSVSNY